MDESPESESYKACRLDPGPWAVEETGEEFRIDFSPLFHIFSTDQNLRNVANSQNIPRSYTCNVSDQLHPYNIEVISQATCSPANEKRHLGGNQDLGF